MVDITLFFSNRDDMMIYLYWRGENDPRVLEFDHRDQTIKNNTVAKMLYGSWERIFNEIQRCDVRCVNCHKIRTSIQLGYYRGKKGDRNV